VGKRENRLPSFSDRGRNMHAHPLSLWTILLEEEVWSKGRHCELTSVPVWDLMQADDRGHHPTFASRCVSPIPNQIENGRSCRLQTNAVLVTAGLPLLLSDSRHATTTLLSFAL
jgi:hypothetical protein